MVGNIHYDRIISSDRNHIVVGVNDNAYKLSGGTLAWRHNNPGNIKYGDFARDFGAIGIGTGGHAVFASYNDGAKAQEALLFSDEGNYYNLTIQEAIAKYAPVDDPNPYAQNNPPRYAEYVAEKAGVSVDTKLKDLTEEQRGNLLDAMREFEGYKVGVIEPVEVA